MNKELNYKQKYSESEQRIILAWAIHIHQADMSYSYACQTLTTPDAEGKRTLDRSFESVRWQLREAVKYLADKTGTVQYGPRVDRQVPKAEPEPINTQPVSEHRESAPRERVKLDDAEFEQTGDRIDEQRTEHG